MAGIYPNLQEKFKCEGICPICMMTMSLSTRYSCTNDHTICHRCRPYYFTCPICTAPMDIEISPTVGEGYYPEPVMPYLPHPYPPYPPPGANPSAPFIDEERRAWTPPEPTEDQELKHCGFSFAGCEARFPERLREMHESRCQFRPNLENNVLPTDLRHDESSLSDCRYRHAGCSVRMPHWRKAIHERACNYRDQVDGVVDSFENLNFQDPEELVDCRFRDNGCMVRMPRRRKHIHEEKCNRASSYDYPNSQNLGCIDLREIQRTDVQVKCPWYEEGCQVMPRLYKRDEHARKCNYRMERCSYEDRGCGARFQPSQRYAHERNCDYA